MTAPARRAAGAQARDRGAAFEADIVTGWRPPYVYLCRTSEPTIMVRRWDALTRIPDPFWRGVPDFHGAVVGRAVAFDAKATGDTRWELCKLTAEQAGRLSNVADAGGLAGVLLRFDATGRVWWLSWADPGLSLAWSDWSCGKAKRGGASLTEDDCARIGVEVRGLRWWEAVGGGP